MMILQGGRREGIQKKRWEDNIWELICLKLGEALRKAENKGGWRKVVSRSSLMPQPSFRLRDKRSEDYVSMICLSGSPERGSNPCPYDEESSALLTKITRPATD